MIDSVIFIFPVVRLIVSIIVIIDFTLFVDIKIFFCIFYSGALRCFVFTMNGTSGIIFIIIPTIVFITLIIIPVTSYILIKLFFELEKSFLNS